MTPERKAYWEKCSLKERTLRALINDEKCAIKALKNNFKYPKNYNFNVLLIMISQCKVRLSAYRHELARLKGMDRVVVPNRSQKYIYRIGEEFKVSKVGFCNCKANLTEVLHVYCPDCGRKILWDKVL